MMFIIHNLMNANTKTLTRVYDYLQETKTATPTQIVKNLNVGYPSVNACLDVLLNFGKVDCISAGRVRLIQIKAEGEKNGNNK
jgi:Mn-dependent DtxR family transcriptional regulator